MTYASVDLPDLFGPMMAAISPALTVRFSPPRIGLPWTETLRSLTSSITTRPKFSVSFKRTGGRTPSSDAAFEADSDQLLRLDRKLHRQLLQDVADKPVDDQRRRLLGRQSPLQAIEKLVLRHLRGRRLVFDHRRCVLGFDVGHRMRAAFVADKERVAVGEIARASGEPVRRNLASIGVLRFSGRNALGDDAARRVAAKVNHLRAAIDLLMSVGDGDRIEFAPRRLSPQDARWVLPGDGGTCLDLGPRNLRPRAAAVAALGDEIVYAAAAFRIARIPVLHRRVLDLRVLEGDEFDDGGVQLVLVALRRGAAF